MTVTISSEAPVLLAPEALPAPAIALSTPELVSMVAALMALNALAIDIMLPALGMIATDLGVTSANDQQLVVVAYILGFGAPQLVFGPLADRFGRRPVLFVSLAGYALTGLACMLAGSFPLLLGARFVQGVFAAGCRVVAVTVVRDAYAGRGMAKLMSLVMTVFMVVPILAPSIGQAILFVAPWRWCFGVLTIAGVAMFVWTAIRLPETLHEEDRRPLDLRSTLGAYREVLSSRTTLGYMVASGIIFGALFAFVSSSEQLFREVFDQGESFALWFAGIAFAMSVASFTNSRLVERFGMRRLGHAALFGFLSLSSVLLTLMWAVGEELWMFFPLFALVFACFGLIGANFNALAMEPLGKVAGTGSAAYGFATTTGAGIIGGAIARQYDGTTLPVLVGFVLLAAGALTAVTITERGKLFTNV